MVQWADNPFGGYVCIQNTPNRANPMPKPPFSWPEHESEQNGKMNYSLTKWQNELQFRQSGPQLGKMFEKWTKKF